MSLLIALIVVHALSMGMLVITHIPEFMLFSSVLSALIALLVWAKEKSLLGTAAWVVSSLSLFVLYVLVRMGG